MNVKSWLAKNTSSLKSQMIIITGATGTLGKATALTLASLGANLILAVRNNALGTDLLERLKLAYPKQTFILRIYDQSSISDIKAFVSSLSTLHIDAFINNAAIFNQTPRKNQDGVEIHLATNSIGPILLTDLLLNDHPKLRVIGVGSLSYFFTNDLKSENLKGTKLYGQTKRIFMSSLISYKLQGADVTLVHPGISATSLLSPQKIKTGRLLYQCAYPLMKIIFMKPDIACLPIVKALFEPLPYGFWYTPRGLFTVWGKPGCHKMSSKFLQKTNFDEIKENCLRVAASGLNKN